MTDSGTPPPQKLRNRRRGPRPKHVPQRMCVACRDHDAKRALVRLVRPPDGPVAVDPTGRRNGRGAYLCHQPACWERALRTGILARALRTEIDEATAAALRDQLSGIRDQHDRPLTPGP